MFNENNNAGSASTGVTVDGSLKKSAGESAIFVAGTLLLMGGMEAIKIASKSISKKMDEKKGGER